MASEGGKPTKTAARARSFDPGRLRPSEFMRARRPELFADSRIIEEPKLAPSVFEYYLNSLTSRKQETEFGHFARRLAERTICPNLLPQTGPTGGGDSKVDAETPAPEPQRAQSASATPRIPTASEQKLQAIALNDRLAEYSRKCRMCGEFCTLPALFSKIIFNISFFAVAWLFWLGNPVDWRTNGGRRLPYYLLMAS
jgi:hypothetical protein